MSRLETGGIPWDEIFDKSDRGKNEGEVKGGSGRALKYAVGEYSLDGKPRVKIHVWDASNDAMRLRATTGVTTQDFKLALVTRGFNGIPGLRHPDFHAGEFVGDALKFFDERWGIIPSHFIGIWLKRSSPSDNYLQFMTSLSETEDPVIAAQNTWSGKIVGEHGYTNIGIRDIYIRPKQITAKFWKPR